MFKFNRLLSTILYCVLIAFVIPSVHSKAKTDKKEKAVKKSKTDSKLDDKISTIPLSAEKEIQRILKSLKESVVNIKSVKTAEKEAYSKRDKAVADEKSAVADEKSTEAAEIAAYNAEVNAYNLAMKKNKESWGSYLKTGSKYNPLWEQKNDIMNKYNDSHESSSSEKDKPTDSKKTAREKRIKVVFDAYTVGIKARESEAKVFTEVTEVLIKTVKILETSVNLFNIEKAKDLVKTVFISSNEVENATKFYNEKFELLKSNASKERQNFEKTVSSQEKLNSVWAQLEKKLDVYNQSVTALNKINQAYKAIIYSENESSDAFKTVWEKAKIEIVEDKKLRVLDKKFKAKEQKSRSTDNPIWNEYFEKWDEYSQKWDEYSQARDSLINLYNSSNSVAILENPEYEALKELCKSTFVSVRVYFDKFKETWGTTSYFEQKETIEAKAEFKDSWSESKKALIEINKAVKEEKMVLRKAVEVGIKTVTAIGQEEKAQEVSKEALKVFKEIKKALERV